MEQTPLKTAIELQQKCLRLMRMNMMTRDIERVGIVHTHQRVLVQIGLYGALYPEPTSLGKAEAANIIASVAGRWALADGE